MKADSHIQIRIDNNLKNKAKKVFAEKGLTLSAGIKEIMKSLVDGKSNVVVDNKIDNKNRSTPKVKKKESVSASISTKKQVPPENRFTNMLS